MCVIWNDDALDDLEDIYAYIHGDNPSAALRVLQRLYTGLERPASNPQLGRTRRLPETREFIFSDIPYIGVYRIRPEDEVVEILGILHAARKYPPDDQ